MSLPAGLSWRHRAFAVWLLVLAATCSLAVTVESAQAAAGTVAIDQTTSPLGTYGDPELITPVLYPATTVTGEVTCPEGIYTRSMTLVQDGQTASWAVGSALGAWDWYCTGRPQVISMYFYNPNVPLHPGPAVASITVYDDANNVLASASSTVSIPNSTPGAPSKAAGGSSSTSTATLTWSPPIVAGGPITGYVVTRDAGGASGQGWSALVPSTSRTQTFAKLTAGRTYRLSVSAVNAQGGGPATSVSVTVGSPAAPTQVSGVAVNSTSATLAWSPPAALGSAPITGYRVSRDNGGTSGSPWVGTVAASTRLQKFLRLAPGGNYTLTVAAINKYGVGSSQSVLVSVPWTG